MVKTIGIREVRRNWPAVEAALQVEKEMLITRYSRPVAKLVFIEQRERWDPEEHMRWLKKMWGNKQVNLVEKYLSAERDER